jgi:hypothetical protein
VSSVIFLNLSIDNNYRTQNKKPIGGNVMDQNGVATANERKEKAYVKHKTNKK